MALIPQESFVEKQATIGCEGKDEKKIDVDDMTSTIPKLSKVALKQKKRRMRQRNLEKATDSNQQPQPPTKVRGMSLVTEYEDLPSSIRRSRIRRDIKRMGVFEETNLKSITRKRVNQSRIIETKLHPLTDFKVKSTAWEAIDDNLKFKDDYTLEELEGMGMEIIQWNGM
jgi:hypothetical protein